MTDAYTDRFLGEYPGDMPNPHRCGWLGTCHREALWHSFVPDEPLPDDWAGVLVVERCKSLLSCGYHIDDVVRLFPTVRVTHEYGDACRAGTDGDPRARPGHPCYRDGVEWKPSPEGSE